ncbi:hypothetical protein [Paraburkholderia sp. J8-2]|uniref:hypothetical protein n=1 Tax=Paraburkholderia sp. J8-2 TaxID=2805440 RepID=UPI002AB6D8B1|nr:hypothetical protein [Paraburkholderia sp. J8-2]
MKKTIKKELAEMLDEAAKMFLSLMTDVVLGSAALFVVGASAAGFGWLNGKLETVVHDPVVSFVLEAGHVVVLTMHLVVVVWIGWCGLKRFFTRFR